MLKGVIYEKEEDQNYEHQNGKKHINQQLSIKNKNKLSKQLEQEQNHRYGGHLEGYQLGGGRGDKGGKSSGMKKHNWQVQNRQGDVKNSIGNEEAKELTCTAH